MNCQRIYKIFGIGESEVNRRINTLSLPPSIRIGYYPVFPDVHLSVLIRANEQGHIPHPVRNSLPPGRNHTRQRRLWPGQRRTGDCRRRPAQSKQTVAGHRRVVQRRPARPSHHPGSRQFELFCRRRRHLCQPPQVRPARGRPGTDRAVRRRQQRRSRRDGRRHQGALPHRYRHRHHRHCRPGRRQRRQAGRHRFLSESPMLPAAGSPITVSAATGTASRPWPLIPA